MENEHIKRTNSKKIKNKSIEDSVLNEEILETPTDSSVGNASSSSPEDTETILALEEGYNSETEKSSLEEEEIPLNEDGSRDIDFEEVIEEEEEEKENVIPPSKPEDVEEDIDPDIEKLRRRKKVSNKVLFNIFGIALLFAIAFVLLLNLFSSDGKPTEEIPVSTEEFENGEEVSVEKAKQIIEQANQDLDEIQENETVIETGSGSGTVTTLPALPSEEEEVVDTGTLEYSNPTYGINFTYPSEWVELLSFTAKEKPENVENVVMVGRSIESGVVDNMRISIEGTPLSITSKKYFESTEGLMKTVFPKFQLISSNELTVSGREAPSRTYSWVPDSELERTPYEQEWMFLKQQQIYVAGKEKVYVITFTSTEEDFAKNFDKYKEILSTLEIE